MTKIFFVMRGAIAPFKPLKRRGQIPLWHPLMYLFDKGGGENIITFLTTFLERKTVFDA
jgi:hypothetical protein